MKKKILVDATALVDPNVSGVGHVALQIVRELSSRKQITDRYKIVLVIPRHTKKMLKRWNLNGNVKVREIPIPSRILNGLVRFNLLPPIDFVIGRGIYLFPNFRNWPLAFSKSLTYIHDVAFMRHPETVATKNRLMLQRKVPQWIKRTNAVITVSNHAKGEIEHFFPRAKGKTFVVHNGVDDQVFTRLSAEKVEKLKEDLGIGSEYFLYLGNIEPRKNLTRLVRAYVALPKDIKKKYALVIAGGHGWHNEEVFKVIHQAQYEGEHIIVPDRFVKDEELPALYSGATLLTHVAIYEGFGVSPLQSLACRTPVVVGKTSSLPEVVGESATYCDPEDITSITKAIQSALKDGHKTLVGAGEQVAKFSWDNSIASLMAVIDNIT